MLLKKEKIDKTIFYKLESIGQEIERLDKLVDTYRINYKTPQNDEVINGYISMPKKITGKLPVLIYIKGGVSIDGSLDDKDVSYFMSWLSSLGYIVIESNLRVKDEIGGEEIEDIYYLENILKSIPEVNLESINILGHSMGGLQTYRILRNSKFENKLGKVIIIAGCSDTIDMMTRRPILKEYWNQFYDTSSKVLNYNKSAINWIDKIPGKLNNLYLLHGKKDTKVDYENLTNLKKNMKLQNKLTYYITLEEAGHNPNQFRNQINKILDNNYDYEITFDKD